MARIIYGVCGEGMGHAMRSRPILKDLSRRHDIRIFTSKGAYNYLKPKFKKVSRIHGMYLSYDNNSINRLGTVISFFTGLPRMIKSIKEVIRQINRFKPNLIITDYDVVTCFAGLIKRIPVISIDNQHIINTEIDIPKSLLRGYLEVKFVNAVNIPHAEHYIVTSFFKPKQTPPDITIVPPILRDSIIRIKEPEGNHILVYQTSNTNKDLIKTLKSLESRFIIYGFNKSMKDSNLVFKRFDDKQFLKDLGSSKGIITNGGFTLITESLYLGKPILSIPVKDQFEQNLNSYYLEKLGLGKRIKRATKEDIEKFIRKCGSHKHDKKKKAGADNYLVIKRIEAALS